MNYKKVANLFKVVWTFCIHSICVINYIFLFISETYLLNFILSVYDSIAQFSDYQNRVLFFLHLFENFIQIYANRNFLIKREKKKKKKWRKNQNPDLKIRQFHKTLIK